MNEDKNDFKRFKEGKGDLELTLENLVALVSSLEVRARLVGAFVIAKELTALRKAAQKTSGSKKIIKSIQKKYDLYNKQLEAFQNKAKTK